MTLKELIGYDKEFYINGSNISYPENFKDAMNTLLFNDTLSIVVSQNNEEKICIGFDCGPSVLPRYVIASYEDTRKIIQLKLVDGNNIYDVKFLTDENNKNSSLYSEFKKSMLSAIILLHIFYLVYKDISNTSNPSNFRFSYESCFSYFTDENIFNNYMDDPIGNRFVEMEAVYQQAANTFENFCNSLDDIEVLSSAVEGTDMTNEFVYRNSGFNKFGNSNDVAKVAKQVIFDSLSDEEKMDYLKDDVYDAVKKYVDGLNDADKALIPTKESIKGYIPSKLFCNVVKMVKYGIEHNDMSMQNILLKGSPGVGKSKMAVALAYVFQMPYRYTQGYKTMDASEYRGTTIASEGKLTTKTDTPMAETARRGGVFVDEDNNYSNEGENTVKNSLLVAPYSMVLADMTTVKRHPFSIFVMTANPEMKGARPINEAYKDRHFIIIDLPSPQDEVLVKMLVNESNISPMIAKKMVDAWHTINLSIKEDNEFADLLTPRSLVNWAKQTVILNNASEACEYNILGALCSSDEFKDKVRTTIIYPRFGDKE